MIKVCHMASSHYPEDVRIFHKECKSLSKAGFDVYLVEVGDTYDKDGVHIIGIGKQSESRLDVMTKDTKKVYEKALAVDADIYHFHEPALLPYGLKLKRRGKIVVFDSHEHTAEALKEKTYIPLHTIVQKLYAAYQRYACKRFDAVVTATPNVTEYFKSFSKRVIDAMNYPILEDYDPLIQRQNCTLAYAGGMNEQWNILHIVNALPQIPEAKFILCSKGGGSYLEKTKHSPGWGQVDHRGQVPHKEVKDILASSSVGMALLSPGPNTDYQNGNMANTKIFEEMMVGVPVICTNFNRWMEFVEKEKCGICVNPHDEEAIAAALKYLFTHKSEAEAMGKAGRKLIETRFNWGNEERKLIALYQELSKMVQTRK